MRILVALAIFIGTFYATATGNLLDAFKAAVLIVLFTACLYPHLVYKKEE